MTIDDVRWKAAFTPSGKTEPNYPAAIHFDLTGARRERVLDAADAMGLQVTHQPGGAFYVWVPTPAHAYQLGRRCKWQGLHPKDDV
jgi:aspartate/methionine/tyrosine aminotransferase